MKSKQTNHSLNRSNHPSANCVLMNPRFASFLLLLRREQIIMIELNYYYKYIFECTCLYVLCIYKGVGGWRLVAFVHKSHRQSKVIRTKERKTRPKHRQTGWKCHKHKVNMNNNKDQSSQLCGWNPYNLNKASSV